MKVAFLDVRAPLPEFELALDFSTTAQRVCIFGPSGAGKTTTLELLAGMRRPSRGALQIDGSTVDGEGRFVAPRDRVLGYAPQDLLLFEHMSAAHNLRYARRGDDPELFARVVEEFALAPLLDRRVALLSGGEKRRITVARAILSAPRLLLLDEPFAGVDDAMRRRMTGFLQTLTVPWLIVTHDQEDAIALSEQVVVLERGRVVTHAETTAWRRSS